MMGARDEVDVRTPWPKFDGNFIKHVNEIEKEDDTCIIMWVSKEVVNEGLSGVNDKVGAAWNSNAKLAISKAILTISLWKILIMRELNVRDRTQCQCQGDGNG
jgi:hypothetical protein